ncbi:YraN family protein [Flavobacterium silvaticum]|uniref:UPF0102 protein G6047_09605 n=1 Tax=Flavobacterium silvaticum TaxID=1852020 RepID=A0A972JGK4_9FLAO|nr:YraN family protein [Flavobacterium silvaticum]NMH28286.1 YraN family protein [Flavobacterium silvaticum]
MATHNEFGKEGERIAMEYLMDKGYIILERNWRYKKLEIDLIAEYQNITIIIEVKSRSNDSFGKPQEFVRKKKIKLVLEAVNAYANTKNQDLNFRLDVISIQKKNGSYTIEHLQDAFYYF